jgi:glycerol-3-phosphate dehydrogenase (NAD(P)+)
MNIQVVGSGSWGLAIARLLANNGHQVSVWCRLEDDPDTLRATRESKTFLPGIHLPESIDIVTETDPEVDIAVLAVPSHVMRIVTQNHSFSKDTILVSVAKGIENDTLQTMDEVLHEVYPSNPVVVLSGPSHAEEVAQDKPASVCAASADDAACESVQQAFVGPAFRVYTTHDVIGVELGGSLKNVIAIAAGICDGLELGDNAIAALMTRGLAEISRLGAAMGADPITFAGLSGMGDLITTCSSPHSRNRSLGRRIAEGKTLKEALAASPMVAEGVRTSKSADALAKKHNVEMPITHQVFSVLFEDANPKEAIVQLMTRDAKSERD